MLSATSVHKRIANEVVLRGVTLFLGPGELVGLIGASGAGKTIFARCLIGLESWDSGTLKIDDLVIDPRSDIDSGAWQVARRTIGLVAQNRALPPYRTILELVSEGPRYVSNMLEIDIEQRVSFWTERLGLIGHLHKYPSEVSGGQLARVCLARALVMEPRYLICDEVTANLDPLMAADVAQALLTIVESGVAVLMISHQIEFLRRYATRVDFLHEGQIKASGPPAELLGKPSNESLAAFLAGSELGR